MPHMVLLDSGVWSDSPQHWLHGWWSANNNGQRWWPHPSYTHRTATATILCVHMDVPRPDGMGVPFIRQVIARYLRV